MPAAPQRTLPLVLVETARDLPASDNGWTPQPYLRFVGGDEGAGQVLGSITVEQHFGLLLPQYRAAFGDLGVVPDLGRTGSGTLVGQLVRLLVQDPAGTITRGTGIYRATYTARWWGQISALTVEGDGAAAPSGGGKATWQAIGIASLLEQITPLRGWVLSAGGTGVVDPGYLPPFNALPGGDRSATTQTVNGATVYVLDLITGAAGSGTPWTAREILDLLLAGATKVALNPATPFTVRGWTWALADPDACLAYTPERIDPPGLTLGQLVNALIPARRGLTWWASVSGATVTIHVRSGVRTPIVGTGYTLPASSKTVALNISSGPWWVEPAVGEDQASTYDVIELRGARPWVGITLAFDGTANTALRAGWTSAAKTIYDGNERSSLARDVYRRFELGANWNGRQYGASFSTVGIRDRLTAATSAAQGADGYTGARTFSDGSGFTATPAWLLSLESSLPCSSGFSTLRIGPRQRPVVMVGSGSAWEDRSSEWSVEVQQTPPAVIIDDGDFGRSIEAEILAGRTVLVSLGVREIQPLRVSWQREPAAIPRALPRVKVIEMPQVEQWTVLAGTVTGVNASGTTLTTQATDLTVRDDLTAMRQVLPLAVATLGRPASLVSFGQDATIDVSTAYRPGTLLTDVFRGDRTQAVDQVITRRRWSVTRTPDGVEQYRTTYECQSVFPDLESVL